VLIRATAAVGWWRDEDNEYDPPQRVIDAVVAHFRLGGDVDDAIELMVAAALAELRS
jgi:hypothetical protein